MIMPAGNLIKESTEKTPRTNKQFREVAVYKINIQKSIAFLYTRKNIWKLKLKIHHLN